MKNFLAVLFVLILFSCNESGVKLGKPSTFVRYFNGGTPDVAQSIIKTSDGGYLILANSQTSLTSTYYRIKLIKVDAYGNQVWQSLLPPVPDPKSQIGAPSYRGFGVTAITDNSGSDTGYFIVGDEIYGDQNANRAQGLLMIQVEPKNGTQVKAVTKTTDTLGIQVQGVGVTRAQNGNYYVLGHVVTAGFGDMFLAEVDAKTFSPVWIRNYGAASTTLVNKVFTYGDSIYWGGTRISNNSQQMRWIGSQVNTSAQFDRPYPSGQALTPSQIPINYSCTDICTYGFGYGFVGSYSLTPGVFNRIAFFRIDQKGNATDSVSYPMTYPLGAPYQAAGNSISSTQDGGFIILGTVAANVSNSDTNYTLIKTNAHGVQQWAKQYGGTFVDVGAKVLQATDGGFIVLGTTNFANVESIFLMKTDADGNIQ